MRDALIYEYNKKPLEIGLMVVSFSRIVVVGFFARTYDLANY